MSLRRIRNRVQEWSLPVLAVAICLLCVKFMEDRAAKLDRHCYVREQALENLATIHGQLRDHRGRHTIHSASLGTVLRTTLSDPEIQELFPGLRPQTRTTHAGLLVQLVPAEEAGR